MHDGPDLVERNVAGSVDADGERERAGGIADVAFNHAPFWTSTMGWPVATSTRPLFAPGSTDAEGISDRIGGRAVGAEAGAEVRREALRIVVRQVGLVDDQRRLAVIGLMNRGAIVDEVEIGADADSSPNR